MADWERQQSGRLVWFAGQVHAVYVWALVETNRYTGISAYLSDETSTHRGSDCGVIAECCGFPSEEMAMAWCETEFRLLRLESAAMTKWKRPAPP